MTRNTIMTSERLREIYGQPTLRAKQKAIQKFDVHCRQFIANSPFLVLATSDSVDLDISPKGDAPGFVVVENDNTLLIPDRPGNNRIDGLTNILAHANVSILFMIPSVTETLRVNGRASIVEDKAVCERFAVKSRLPRTVLKVTAEQIFIHCGKAPMRAGLWETDSWPKERPVTTLNEMVRDHANIEVDSIDQRDIETGYRQSLY